MCSSLFNPFEKNIMAYDMAQLNFFFLFLNFADLKFVFCFIHSLRVKGYSMI